MSVPVPIMPDPSPSNVVAPGGLPSPVNAFVQRHQKDILGVLSCFDRILFQGTLPKLRFAGGMEALLRNKGIQLKDYTQWAEPLKDQIRANAEQLAADHAVPIRFLRNKRVRQEELVQKILQTRGRQAGLVAIFSTMERCETYRHRYHKRKHRWILIPDRGLCLHYYFYFIDPWLGWCFARVPTWAPFRFQVYANGHQWLARRLEGEGIGYRMADNAFLSVDDFERAQELANSAWRVEELHRQLDGFAQRCCPILKELETNFQWTVNQCEYATDVIFKKPELLQPLYERLIRTAVQTVQAGMLATFLGNRAQGNYPHEGGNHLRKRTQGTRLKHVLGKLSIKVYDKMGSILRVETTANDVSCFGHYRLVEQRNGGGLVRKRAKMKKSIYSLPILRERMHGSNHRYLDFLSAIDDPRAGLRKLHKLCEPVECNQRSYAGFNFFSPQDLALMTVLMRGEYNTNGLRNKDLREHLEDRSPGQVSRLLKRLRLHGLVKKSGGGYRYFVTSLGKQALALGLMLRDQKIIPALAS